VQGHRGGLCRPIESAIEYSGACPLIHPLAFPRCCGCTRLTAVALVLAGTLLAWAAQAATSASSLPAVRAAPDSRAADPFLEVRRLMRAGEASEALARLEGAAPEQAREPRWRFLRGVLLAELGRTEEAAAAYTALTQEFPELAEPYNNLAVLRAAQGRIDEARVALESALRADPSHREARENLGDVYVRLAVRLWEGIGPNTDRGAAGPEPGLARKLRLAREIGAPAR
jgi:tetratricopeptide (TPR) repeat protein